MTYVSVICLVWNYTIFLDIVSYNIIKGYLCVHILYPTVATNITLLYWIVIMIVVYTTTEL